MKSQNFQLPLSGSLDALVEQMRQQHETTSFNSLSRDHNVVFPMLATTDGYCLSTPSLGITYELASDR